MGDNVGVDESVAVSSNSLVGEVFELPLFLVLALEAFVDLEAGAADFALVTRMFGRPNLIASLFKRVVSIGSADRTEEVEV